MDTGLKISKRLILASIFGIVLMGSALYYTSQEPKAANIVDNNTQQNVDDSIQDTAKTEEGATREVTEPQDDTLSKTDLLTSNLLSPYLAQIKQGTYSPTSKESIVANATEQMFTLDFTPLQPQDILTTSNISTERASAYKQALYTAVQPLFALSEYELTIYARAIRDNSEADFDSLQSIATIYKKAGDDVLTIVAPRDVSAVHLAIINSLYKFSIVLGELAKGYDDPAASLAGSGQFNTAEEEVGQAFSQLQTYFILKDVATTEI